MKHPLVALLILLFTGCSATHEAPLPSGEWKATIHDVPHAITVAPGGLALCVSRRLGSPPNTHVAAFESSGVVCIHSLFWRPHLDFGGHHLSWSVVGSLLILTFDGEEDEPLVFRRHRGLKHSPTITAAMLREAFADPALKVDTRTESSPENPAQ